MKLNIIDNAVITKSNNLVKYAFIPITEEQYEAFDEDIQSYYNGEIKVDDFKNKWGIRPSNAIMHGDTSDVTSSDISDYIEMTHVNESKINNFRPSYKCFCGEKHGLDFNKTVLHGSARDSFNCLLVYTGNPKNGIILNLMNHEAEI